MYRVLLNTLRDGRARRWNGEIATADLPEALAPTVDLVYDLVVRRALAALRVEHREVLVLRYYPDLSEREMAAVLGVPVGTVTSRTARALSALGSDHNIVRSG